MDRQKPPSTPQAFRLEMKTPPEALADPYVDVRVCTAILLILLVEACVTEGKGKRHRGDHICIYLGTGAR